MNVLFVRSLQGANIWAKVSVLEAKIDLGDSPSMSPTEVADFQRRLDAELPSLSLRRASGNSGATSGATSELTLACALRDVTLELRAITRPPSGIGRIEPTDLPHVFCVVIQCDEEEFDRACLACACRLCNAIVRGERFDTAAQYQKLEELGADLCVGDHTGPVLDAAIARGIPWRRLDKESLVQLGWGSRQERIQKTLTSHTRKIAEWISLDKQLTKNLFEELGIPVPVGRLVTSEDDAWAAASEIGLPVIVKPRDADYGKGVGLNLKRREEVLAAYRVAKKLRNDVMVERHVEGNHYRVTIVAGRVVAADERVIPIVVGDGESTVREPISRENLNPRRGDHRFSPLNRIVPDTDAEQVLAEQGFDLDTTIIPSNVQVSLSRVAHLWAGAGCHDVTDRVHPLVAAQCISAARALGLDVAGVDVIAPNIGQPLEGQGGAILEVNAEPGIFMHLAPFSDIHRPVCERIIESLFPTGETGRIPLVCVLGGANAATSCHWTGHLLSTRLGRIGVATSDGLFLDSRRLKGTQQSNLAGLRSLLLHPEVDAGVVEQSLAGIRAEGLGFDFCDVAVIIDSSDALDPEALKTLRVLIEAVAPNGHIVTDASEPLLALLDVTCDSRVTRIPSTHGGALTTKPSAGSQRSVEFRSDAVVLSGWEGLPSRVSLDEYLVPAPE